MAQEFISGIKFLLTIKVNYHNLINKVGKSYGHMATLKYAEKAFCNIRNTNRILIFNTRNFLNQRFISLSKNIAKIQVNGNIFKTSLLE